MGVTSGKFKPHGGCLSDLSTTPICAHVPIPFPSRAPLPILGKLKSCFLDCLSRENMYTYAPANPKSVAHTSQVSFHLTMREKCQKDMSNLQQTVTSFQKLHPLCPHRCCAGFLVSILAENGLSKTERRYLMEKIPLAASGNYRN